MTRFSQAVLQQGRLAMAYPGAILVAAWLLTMISLPVVGWTVGSGAFHAGISFGVLVQVAVVVFILVQAWGWREALRVVLWVLGLAWVVEFVGSQTGVPFGTYHYTPLLQPQLGHVPLLIPLAWLMMLPPAWAVAERILARRAGLWVSQAAFVFLAALAFTAWDLFLDPQMVAWDFWRWEQPGAYFGIPWSNYFGWLLASGLITALVRPRRLPLVPLVAVYLLTWLLQTIGQFFFWEMPGPAAAGFLGMGIFIVLATWPAGASFARRAS
ncbi:MAG: carotenoid biosynthesis protein [Chloroflexota bacterium]